MGRGPQHHVERKRQAEKCGEEHDRGEGPARACVHAVNARGLASRTLVARVALTAQRPGGVRSADCASTRAVLGSDADQEAPRQGLVVARTPVAWERAESFDAHARGRAIRPRRAENTREHGVRCGANGSVVAYRAYAIEAVRVGHFVARYTPAGAGPRVGGVALAGLALGAPPGRELALLAIGAARGPRVVRRGASRALQARGHTLRAAESAWNAIQAV